MEEGKFRRDLFFRLNAIHFEIPPLRRRRGDVPVLVQHFVAQHNARHDTRKGVSPAAGEVLLRYDWPGNVRELRHVVERALVVAERDLIRPGDLPIEVRQSSGVGPGGELANLTLAGVERVHIARVLELVGGHRARAAQLLDISERNLYRRIREYELEQYASPTSER
jgi:DNA-binding NtrC family response regulator